MRVCPVLLASFLGLSTIGLAQSAQQTYAPLKMSPPPGFAASRQLTRLSPSKHLSISVSLAYRDPAGIQRFVASVSDPSSPEYRHFISPAEVGKRFGPGPATLAKVEKYLTDSGIKIKLVGDNGLSILADATVAQAESAFKTQIYEYHSLSGYAPATGVLYSYAAIPSIPADIQPAVVEIGGLENFSHPQPASAVTPNQIQTLYDLAPMYSQGAQGQGRTIGISNWDGYRLANVPYEYSRFGLPSPPGGVGSNITVKTISGGAGSGTEQGEGDLDIQAILGVAPLCNLIIYDGGNSDLIGVLTQEANDNQADVISESYGWTLASSTKTAAHNLHLSMSAEGITYMAASGDSGTTLNYYYPDIEPEVLLVGGTTVTVDSSGHRVSETGWSGSGGGWKATTDAFNVLPGFQSGTGVPTSTNYRLLPDVALDADPNSGYVVYLQGGYYVIGGTSGASPTFAGSLGDAEQQLILNGALTADGAGHQRFGRIQDLIYSMNGDPSVFYDVASGSNGTLPSGSTSNAGVGWDFVTGWGAMDFNGFVTRQSGTGLVQFSLSPSSIEGGTGSVTATVRMTSQAPSGGTAISISGGDSAISYPATVTIPSGSYSTTFTISTSAVTTNHTEALTATQGSQTKTATLTVTATGISAFTFSPTSGPGGASFTGTITLLHAATGTGDVVGLSGGDANVTYPSTVTVAAGSKTGTFTMTSRLVASTDVETITATLGSSTKPATVTLSGLSIASLAFSPASVVGGATPTGTITLSGAAPASGETISLSGGDSVVSVPATVQVAGNSKTATFKVTTNPTATNANETITATLGSSSQSGSFTVTAPALTTFALSPNSVFGGVSSTGTVTLTGAAPAGGVSVGLSGGDSYVGYPSTVTVASGAKSATFNVTTSVVAANDAETLTASANSVTATASLTVKPAGVVSSLTLTPASVVGGASVTGTIKLTGGAGPNGVVVSVSGGDSSISYPTTVTIPSGVSSKTFTVTTTALTASATEALTATIGPSSAQASFTVQAPALSGFALSPNSVFGGVSSTGTVTLTGIAPTGGITVALSGGDSYVTYPSTITVAAGSKTATFTVATSVVSTNDAETLAASSRSVNLTAALTVKPAGVVSSLTLSPATVIGGGTVTGTIKLTGGAGPAGVVVAITGGDSSISYPASVTIPSGVSSKTFAITTSPLTAAATEALTATIGPSSAHASFTVQAVALTTMTVAPTSVYGGQTSTGTINLNGPAPGAGFAVALSGGDSSISVPATVTVPGGAKSATFTITTSVVATNDAEALAATAGSAKANATLTVKPAGIVSTLTLSPASPVGGSNVTGTVKLTGAAGPNGVVVSLTGGDTSISYPSSLTIASGASSGTFTITTIPLAASDAEPLTATIGPSSASATLTIQATALASAVLSPTSVYGGQTSTGTLTLNGPAPAGGMAVALSGGDSSVSYPLSVTVAAGAKTATFTVTTSTVQTNTTEALSAAAGVTKTLSLTVKPAGVVSSLALSPAAPVGGNNVAGTVKLTGPAGPNGVVVSLSGGDSSISYPATVTIPAGGTSGTFTVATLGVDTQAPEALTATIGPSSAHASFTLGIPALASLVFAPTSVSGGTPSTATITLTGAAGPSGVVIQLASGDPTVSVPSSVTVPAGSRTVTFTATTSSVSASKTVKVTATLGSVAKPANLTVHT